MLEVIRDSEVAKKADWVKEYVDSAIAVTSSAAAMFTYDPPRAYALSHVYLLRYCNTVREYIEALTRSIDNNDSDGFLKVLDLYKSANAELQKASTLSPK